VSSYGNKYILVAVDYVSKWVEGVALHNTEGRSVVQFLKRYISQGLALHMQLLVMGDLIFATAF